MTAFLQQKPHTIGIISSLASSFLYWIQHLLTDEHILKMVAGLGTWAGTFVAILAGIAASKKYFQTLKIKK